MSKSPNKTSVGQIIVKRLKRFTESLEEKEKVMSNRFKESTVANLQGLQEQLQEDLVCILENSDITGIVMDNVCQAVFERIKPFISYKVQKYTESE